MAKPFFSGDYGSALAKVDTRPIVEAGKAQGQMFSNLGSQIGGVIQQYGLNKEKQKENKATIKSSVGILERMKKLDPENETEYMMSIDQLNNEDMGLGMRAKLADKTLQGLSITSRLQGEMLNRDSQRQALGLAKRTEDLTVENLKLGNRQKELGTLLGEISLEELKAIKDEKTRVALLTLKERGKDLLLGDERRKLEKETMAGQAKALPGATDATIASNLLKKEGSEAELKLMPKRTAATEAALETSVMKNEQAQNLIPGYTSLAIKKQNLDSIKIDTENFLIDAFGGAEGKAKFDYRGEEIKRENFEKGLEYLDARIDYTNYLSTARNVPIDTKKQYASLVSHSGKILDTRVEDPETGNPITFEKYMEIANDGDIQYPLTGDGSGAAGVLYSNYLSAQKQIIDFGKTIQVQVDDGQGVGGSPTTTGSPINVGNMQPEQAMQKLRDRIGELRRLGPDINAQRQQLGQPGQFNPIGMGGNFRPTQVPQTVGYIQQQNDALTQQEEQRKSELAEAEAQLQELQNQLGLR